MTGTGTRRGCTQSSVNSSCHIPTAQLHGPGGGVGAGEEVTETPEISQGCRAVTLKLMLDVWEDL